MNKSHYGSEKGFTRSNDIGGMRMRLKELLPMSINFWIKYGCQYIKKNKIEIPNSKEPIIYYLDSPDYGNVGDLAIREGVIRFIKATLQGNQIVEVNQGEFPKVFYQLKKMIRPRDVICLTGGGNMGATYQKFEVIRRLVIKSFPRNKIVIFPQTIDYKRNHYGIKEKTRASMIYSNNKNLIITARENVSYELMNQLYKNTNVIITPDIVLSLENYFYEGDKKGVLIAIRDDIESKINVNDRNKIKIKCKEFGEEILTTDTTLDISQIERGKLYNLVPQKINEFGSAKLVITDRLHGMIFSVISGTTCIVFENSNHKIAGTYEWLKNLEHVILVKSMDDFDNAIDKAIKLMNNSYKFNIDESMYNNLKIALSN